MLPVDVLVAFFTQRTRLRVTSARISSTRDSTIGRILERPVMSELRPAREPLVDDTTLVDVDVGHHVLGGNRRKTRPRLGRLDGLLLGP